MSCKVTTLSLTVSGASFASALAILREKLALRRLPGRTTTLYGVAMRFPFDAGLGSACGHPSDAGKRCKCMNFRSMLSASFPGAIERPERATFTSRKHQVVDLANNGR